MGDVISDDRTWMVANYIVLAGSTLWIAEFIETLPTEIDSIWVNRKITGTSMLFLMNRYMFLLGLIFQALRVLPGNGTNKESTRCQVIDGLYSLLQSVTSAITNILIEALEPGISTVGSPFEIFSRCKTNPKGELPLNQRDCTSCNQYAQTLSRSIQYSANHRPGWYSVFPSYPRLGSDRWHFVNLSPRYQRDLRETQLYDMPYGRQDCLTYHTQQDPLSDVVGPFFNVFSNLLISRLMLNLHTFTTSTITTSQGAASTDQSSSLLFAQQILRNRNIGGPLDGEFVGEEIEFE
ncbi:hypothetical protein GG344DRAFT_66069 [Lentinula edodes]|nr:hypothetical protein GG344DRAFT_66069 [Lentinula edodes]